MLDKCPFFRTMLLSGFALLVIPGHRVFDPQFLCAYGRLTVSGKSTESPQKQDAAGAVLTVRPLELQFAKEMNRHNLSEIVRALGLPLGSSRWRDAPDAHLWKIRTSIITPLDRQALVSGVELSIQTEVILDQGQDLETDNKVAVFACIICQNLETRQIWSQPFRGMYIAGEGISRSAVSSTVAGWRLPVGDYLLTCVAYVQSNPTARLIFGDATQIRFSVTPSIEKAAFLTRFSQLRQDKSLSAPECAGLIHKEMEKIQLTPDIWSVISDWKNASVVNFSGFKLSKETFHALTQFPKLEVLLVRNSYFSSGELASLKEMSNLRVVDLSGVRLVPGSLASLSSCRHLEVLRLSDTCLNRADLIAIGACRNLLTLDLVRCRFDDGIPLGSLSGSSKLSELSIKAAALDAEDLMDLARFQSLKILDLSWTEVCWDKVNCLRFSDTIEIVNLSSTGVTSEGIEVFLKCKGLKRIGVNADSIEMNTRAELDQRGVVVNTVVRPLSTFTSLWEN